MARARIASKGSGAVRDAGAVPLDKLAGTMVTVGGKTAHIGKMSLDQWLALPRFAARVFDQLPREDTDELRRRVGEASDTAALQDAFSWLMPILTADNVVELYGIITDLPERHLRDTFDMAEFVDCVVAVTEHNDIARLISAFRRAAGRWRSRSENSSDQRLSS